MFSDKHSSRLLHLTCKRACYFNGVFVSFDRKFLKNEMCFCKSQSFQLQLFFYMGRLKTSCSRIKHLHTCRAQLVAVRWFLNLNHHLKFMFLEQIFFSWIKGFCSKSPNRCKVYRMHWRSNVPWKCFQQQRREDIFMITVSQVLMFLALGVCKRTPGEPRLAKTKPGGGSSQLEFGSRLTE